MPHRRRGQPKSAKQQTRTLAGVLYSAASKVVWGVALLTALPEFGINVTPVATLAGLASLALGFGAQSLVRDIISGFYIVLEDQYAVGDTIQFADYTGRVETPHLAAHGDPRCARRAGNDRNGEIRTVSNLSRDWSQAFVDVSLAPESPLEKSIAGAGDRRGRFAGRSRVVANAGGRAADPGCARL